LNLQDYWNNRARFYKCEDVVGRQILKTFIQKIQPSSLIEIGCGTGILFSLYKDVPYVVGCDFSWEMLKRARQRCERHNLSIKLFLNNIVHNSPEGFWDLLVTRTCLMHIPPEQIERAVENISKICSEALVFEFWQQVEPLKLAPHNWLHDYQTLFENAGFNLEYVYVREGVAQVLFWFKKVKQNG